MTPITREEAEMIAGDSKRPRFTLLLWIVLLDRAGTGSYVECSRAELAEEVAALLPEGRYVGRSGARAARIKVLREEEAKDRQYLATAVKELPEDKREAVHKFRSALITVRLNEAIGDPTGQNISHAIGDLKKSGLLSVGYLDGKGDLYDKPAKGRKLSLTLHRIGA